MQFDESIKNGFRNYATFKGRASRSEFWWWVLFAILASLAGNLIDSILGMSNSGPVGGLVGLALAIPGIAVTVRRLHDTDHSGWWYWVAFTIIGLIPLLIWTCSPGMASANAYGPDPLGAPAGHDALDGTVW